MEGVASIVLYDDFLDVATLTELIDCTLENEAAFEPSGVGQGQANDRVIRSSRRAPEPAFKPWRDRLRALVEPLLPDLATAVGVAPFAPARLEVQLIAHNDDDFYRTPIGTAIGGAPRQRAS